MGYKSYSMTMARHDIWGTACKVKDLSVISSRQICYPLLVHAHMYKTCLSTIGFRLA